MESKKALCYLVINPKTLASLKLYIHLEECIYLSQNGGKPAGNAAKEFSCDDLLQYNTVYDDFGPTNLLSCIKFNEIMDKELNAMREKGQKQLVFCVAPGKRMLTNATFLLGTYMIISLKLNAQTACDCFKDLNLSLLEEYRDASVDKPKFKISLIDCWRGIDQAKTLGWFKLPSFHAPFMWGLIDKDAYEHYDNPLNADLNEIVPRKIVAFRGPKDLPNGLDFCNNIHHGTFINRDFSPAYFAKLLKDLGVSTVVRLNRPEYDKRAFTEQGFEHFDLDFQGRSTPPPQVVTAFFRIVDKARGLVAVHGREGLGRPATLIALYLMRTHRFGAREAIAWLRVMRPGSVLGEQQAYLADIEQSVQAAARSPAVPRCGSGESGAASAPRSSESAGDAERTPLS